jgi:CRP-like cAMP-binding protein
LAASAADAEVAADAVPAAEGEAIADEEGVKVKGSEGNPVDLARRTELFAGLGASDVESLVYRLNGVRKVYEKGETVVHAGLEAVRLMVVVSGHLHVYEEMSEDRHVLVREIGPGEVLGLWILNVPEVNCWPGTVVAAEDSVLLSLNMEATRSALSGADGVAARLAANASKILSRELFRTWRKLTVMDAPTIEARIRTYLSVLDNETGRTGRVAIPFDRERMAEYFGVTRPALSRAIGQMRDRGLLTWRKNVFTIRF